MLPTPVLVTFVLVLGIIGATYYLLVLKPEEEEQSALRKRLKGSVPAALKNASLQRQDSPLSTIPIIDTLLAGGSRFSRTDPEADRSVGDEPDCRRTSPDVSVRREWLDIFLSRP